MYFHWYEEIYFIIELNYECKTFQGVKDFRLAVIFVNSKLQW